MIALARRPDVKRDLEFCSETVRAANSACRNIAEGFARYKHPQFAHHVNIAIGSLGELFDSNDEARCKGYVSDIEYLELERLVEQARQCAIGLHDYLESTPTPPRKRRRGGRSHRASHGTARHGIARHTHGTARHRTAYARRTSHAAPRTASILTRCFSCPLRSR